MTDAGNWLPPNARRGVRVLGFLLLLGVVALFIAIAVPQVAGADKTYVVMSDSMSPAIGAGGVVFVQDASSDSIQVGDVVTYDGSTVGLSESVTHRVVAIESRDGERYFQTKGDANDAADSQLVSSEQIEGRVAFNVPLAGWLVHFANTRLGILTLIVVPATLLVISEVWSLQRGQGDRDSSINGQKQGKS